MEQRIVNVIPATRMQRGGAEVFSYLLPPGDQAIPIGSVVEIPFGKKNIRGVVAGIQLEAPAFKLKHIAKVISPEAVITPQLLALAEYLSQYYATSLGLLIKSMLVKVAPRARKLEQLGQNFKKTPDFKLTRQQLGAVDEVTAHINARAPFLLHGVTGSGKTEVYLQILKQVLHAGKQALILVPEISLTPQTLARFLSRFPESEIAAIHSKISYGQKYLIWRGISAGKIKVLIGPRSAVFAPFSALGFIVMDEEHDSSYKQSEQNPKFDARVAAYALSKIWSCPLIFGDATPSVETYWLAKRKIIKYLNLPNRIGQELPQVELVDMKNEARTGNYTNFSRTLAAQIRETLAKSRQVILFINRRGTFTSMSCRDCGSPVVCRRCTVPLVYHASSRSLICHHCGISNPLPAFCRECKSHRLGFGGTGTEKIEFEIAAAFPNARIIRFDSDTVAAKNRIASLYKRLASGNFDILVGTQLLAKGWDFENVGLIGVLNADTALSFPDFRSNERTFQLITQIAGRAGRRQELGKVVFQTYSPENFAIQAALNHDYSNFFEKEIGQREDLGYPPYRRLIKCTVKNLNFQKALDQAQNLVKAISEHNPPGIEVLGPTPAFISKLRNIYRVYVIIKVDNVVPFEKFSSRITDLLHAIPPSVDIDVDPGTLL